jgi:scyllo-inositol 2-dehydrogenase (NADP+)
MQAINTAILSFGMSGQVFHAPFIRVHDGFNFYAVWERSKNLAQEKYPDVKTYRTLEELLADDNVELVIVNTPNYTHFDYTKKALQAGKHVIVEKPFVTTVAEGEELIQLARERNVLLSVFQNRRYDSDYKVVKQVADEGLVGDIVEAEFHFDRFKEELSPKDHKEVPGPGAGILYDLGPHLIDQAIHLFGMPGAVFADTRVIRPASRVDDYFELLFYYPHLRVRLHASYYVKEPMPSFILHGTKGTFLKPRADVQEADLQGGKIPGTSSWGLEPETEKGLLNFVKDGKDSREFIPSLQGNYMDYFDGIFNALRKHQPVPVTAVEGLNVVRIIQAAFKSNDEQRVVAL